MGQCQQAVTSTENLQEKYLLEFFMVSSEIDVMNKIMATVFGYFDYIHTYRQSYCQFTLKNNVTITFTTQVPVFRVKTATNFAIFLPKYLQNRNIGPVTTIAQSSIPKLGRSLNSCC
jgi:hypothetical protein